MVIQILVGALLGFLSGLGVGGGSLLILWLTLVQGKSPEIARSINLLFFLPCALVAAIFRWKQGSIPFRKILPAIACGCAAAYLCAGLSARIDITLLKKLFGGLMILTGLRELLYKERTRQ